MGRYAQGTEVPADRSKGEIERILTRYGATGFGYMVREGMAVVLFAAHDRQLRFNLPLPDPGESARTRTGRKRAAGAAREEWEKETRRRWRALALDIKAKLEAVETGITVFEQEFLPHIVLPGGRTVAEMVIPRVEQAYRTGKMVALLPDWTGGEK